MTYAGIYAIVHSQPSAVGHRQGDGAAQYAAHHTVMACRRPRGKNAAGRPCELFYAAVRG